jgi:hypothetical protein
MKAQGKAEARIQESEFRRKENLSKRLSVDYSGFWLLNSVLTSSFIIAFQQSIYKSSSQRREQGANTCSIGEN